MSFLMGVAKGFAERSIEKNDAIRKQQEENKKSFYKDALLPQIELYKKNKDAYQQRNVEIAERVDIMKIWGVKEENFAAVYAAGLNSKGEWEPEKAREYYKTYQDKLIKRDSTKTPDGEALVGEPMPVDSPSEQPQATSGFQGQTDISTDSFSTGSTPLNFQKPAMAQPQAATPMASAAPQAQADQAADQAPSRSRSFLQTLTGSGSAKVDPEARESMIRQAAETFGIDPEDFRRSLAQSLVEKSVTQLLTEAYGPQFDTTEDALSLKSQELENRIPVDARRAAAETAERKKSEITTQANLSGAPVRTVAAKDAGVLSTSVNPVTGETSATDLRDGSQVPLTQKVPNPNFSGGVGGVPSGGGGLRPRDEPAFVGGTGVSKDQRRAANDVLGRTTGSIPLLLKVMDTLNTDPKLGNTLWEWGAYGQGILDNVGITGVFKDAGKVQQLRSQLQVLNSLARDLAARTGSKESVQEIERNERILAQNQPSGPQMAEVLESIFPLVERQHIQAAFALHDEFDDPALNEQVADQVAIRYARERIAAAQAAGRKLSQTELDAIIKASANAVNKYNPRKYR